MTTSADPPPALGPPAAPPAELLAGLPIAGVPERLRDGPDALVVRDDPGDAGASPASRVFHLPKHEAAAASQRLRVHLLPYLRGHLTPAVPLPEPQPAPGARWSGTAAPWLPGQPLLPAAITERNEDRLARALAQFLVELHRYPAQRAQSLGVPGPREWRSALDGLRRRSLTALRPELGITKTARVRRWWRAFLAADAWAFSPALTHGNLDPAHLLTDPEARDLQAVLGWSRVAVADPALDIAAVSEHYGADFGWLVLEAYRQRGGVVDADFLTRVRRQAALLPLLTWDRAQAPGEKPAPERTQVLLQRLRDGPVLSA